MTYCIRMGQDAAGVDGAELVWGGRTFRAQSRHGASMALARQLCAAGAPDGPWEVVWTTGREKNGS